MERLLTTPLAAADWSDQCSIKGTPVDRANVQSMTFVIDDLLRTAVVPLAATHAAYIKKITALLVQAGEQHKSHALLAEEKALTLLYRYLTAPGLLQTLRQPAAAETVIQALKSWASRLVGRLQYWKDKVPNPESSRLIPLHAKVGYRLWKLCADGLPLLNREIAAPFLPKWVTYLTHLCRAQHTSPPAQVPIYLAALVEIHPTILKSALSSLIDLSLQDVVRLSQNKEQLQSSASLLAAVLRVENGFKSAKLNGANHSKSAPSQRPLAVYVEHLLYSLASSLARLAEKANPNNADLFQHLSLPPRDQLHPLLAQLEPFSSSSCSSKAHDVPLEVETTDVLWRFQSVTTFTVALATASSGDFPLHTFLALMLRLFQSNGPASKSGHTETERCVLSSAMTTLQAHALQAVHSLVLGVPAVSLTRFGASLRRICQGHLRRWSALTVASQILAAEVMSLCIDVFGVPFAQQLLDAKMWFHDLLIIESDAQAPPRTDALCCASFHLLGRLIRHVPGGVQERGQWNVIHTLVQNDTSNRLRHLAYDCGLALLRYAPLDVAFASVLCRVAADDQDLRFAAQTADIQFWVTQHIRRACDPFFQPRASAIVGLPTVSASGSLQSQNSLPNSSGTAKEDDDTMAEQKKRKREDEPTTATSGFVGDAPTQDLSQPVLLPTLTSSSVVLNTLTNGPLADVKLTVNNAASPTISAEAIQTEKRSRNDEVQVDEEMNDEDRTEAALESEDPDSDDSVNVDELVLNDLDPDE